MSFFFIQDHFKDLLAEEHLATFSQVHSFERGQLMSRKKLSSTWRWTLKTGQVVYIKQDIRSCFRATLRQLLKFRRPLSATEKECEKIRRMKGLGFQTAEVILQGAQRRLGFLPHKAVMISLAVPGVSLDELWHSEVSQEEKDRALQAALAVWERLWQSGCDWRRDGKPEHFFYHAEENAISLIDVERMLFFRRPIPQERRREQLLCFMELLKRQGR